jgi:hypothetical protein
VVNHRPDFVLARPAALVDLWHRPFGWPAWFAVLYADVDARQSTTPQEPSRYARRSLSACDAPAIGCVPCEISRTDGPGGTRNTEHR